MSTELLISKPSIFLNIGRFFSGIISKPEFTVLGCNLKSLQRHGLWELQVDGYPYPVLASSLVQMMGGELANHVVAQSLLKSYIAKSANEGKNFVCCGICGCPLIYVAKNAVQEAHFRHLSNKAPDPEKMEICPFYTGNDSFFSGGDIYMGEGEWHFRTKHRLAAIIEASEEFGTPRVEKMVFSQEPDFNSWRRPDIAFEDKQGNAFVIELTRWWMSPDVVQKRELFFRKQGVNLIWLFSPECETSNAATLNMILYGSPASRHHSSDLSALRKVECNAFLLSPEVFKQSEKTRELKLICLYPSPKYDSQSDEIFIEYCREIITFSSLNLAAEKRLPFAINTSALFNEALDQKHRTLRSKAAKSFRDIRSIARGSSLPLQKVNPSELQKACDYALKYQQMVNADSRIRTYVKRAQLVIDELVRLQHERQSRQMIASTLRQRRNHVFQLLQELNRYYCDPLLLKNELDSLKGEELASLNPGYQRFLNRALAKVGEKQLIQQRQNEAQEEKRRIAMANFIADRDDFLAKIRQGFPDVVEDETRWVIRAKRLQQESRKHGLGNESASLLDELHTAIVSAKQQYLMRTYPALSQLWSDNLMFQADLEKAFSLLAESPHRKAPQAQKVRAYQKCSRELLYAFRASLGEAVNEAYSELLHTEPARLLATFNRFAQPLRRAKKCLQLLRKNRISCHQEVDIQIEIFKQCFEMSTRGEDTRDIIRHVRQENHTRFGNHSK